MLADDTIVYYKDKPALKLNQRLIVQTNRTPEQVEHIKVLHQERVKIEEDMTLTPVTDREKLKQLNQLWVLNQGDLQDAWGFDRNQNYYKFWTVPHCNCPQIDNYDAYPTGYYVVNRDCPIHGD